MKEGAEEITLKNGLGTNSTDRSNEIHQDLSEIWMGERGGVLDRRRRRKS
jgi:hypothetical protein